MAHPNKKKEGIGQKFMKRFPKLAHLREIESFEHEGESTLSSNSNKTSAT
jgi:hypothetical protein